MNAVDKNPVETDPSKSFFAPVFRDMLFESRTEAAFKAFFDSKPMDVDGNEIFLVRCQFFLDPQDRNHVVTVGCPSLIVRDKTGAFASRTTIGCHEKTEEALGRLLVVLNSDFMAEQSIADISVLPWEEMSHELQGRFFAIDKTRDFSICCQEYMPTWQGDRAKNIAGLEAAMCERRAYFQICMPEATSAHQKIDEIAIRKNVETLAHDIYNFHTVGCSDLPFGGVDWTTVNEL